jgi:ribosome-binding factor A
MKPQRRERLQEQLLRDLSDIVQNRLRDPRRGWMSITRVDLSSDLSFARVYVSVMGTEKEQEAGMSVLEAAKTFVRGELGRRLRVRVVPELQFRLDRSLEASQRVMRLLDELEIPPEEHSPAEDRETDGGEGE